MAWGLVSVCSALFAFASESTAQTASALSQVKKVYVEPFGEANGAARLRDRTIEQLRQRAKLQIVADRHEADAVVKGEASLWLTGYLSTDPRSPSTTRQPIFQGYLSIELMGKDNDPLWSYLVTPSEFRSGGITKDLADRLVEKLVQAYKERETVAQSGGTQPTGEIDLTAAGATFPAPLYQKWFESFHQRHPSVEVTYSSVGSEAGIQLAMNRTVDFAASDVPLSDERMAQANLTFLHFASVVGAVVPVYNLKGVGRNLNFTPEVLAKIYSGKIKRWNDLALRDSNPNASLPDTEIVVIHRSDGSGTTFVWTDYLSQLNPEWKASVGSGTRVRWPVGVGANGNEGIATLVQQTANSIGYVELAYALQHQLSFGAVRNSAGKFIQADLPSVTAAAADAAAKMGVDSRVSILNSSVKDAYPIATFTWWLVPQDIRGDKRIALHELLHWMLFSGQKECSALAYAPLPRQVINRELQLLDNLK